MRYFVETVTFFLKALTKLMKNLALKSKRIPAPSKSVVRVQDSNALSFVGWDQDKQNLDKEMFPKIETVWDDFINVTFRV